MTIEEIIEKTLQEDTGDGDHTSLATVPQSAMGRARLIIKQKGILAGGFLAEKVFHHLCPELLVQLFIADGNPVQPGDIVFEVSGPARFILTGERTILNFIQRLSGIATTTHQMVSAIEGYPAKLLDTRKTTPLLRELEKYAVRMGGGYNHRFGLYDMMMIKDNHVDFAGGIRQAIVAANEYLSHTGKSLKIEIEVRNFPELEEVLQTGKVQRIMLDNFPPDKLAEAVRIIAKRFETEASGGITLQNLREYAATGVDFISVGALTHQISSLDMSLKAF